MGGKTILSTAKRFHSLLNVSTSNEEFNRRKRRKASTQNNFIGIHVAHILCCYLIFSFLIQDTERNVKRNSWKEGNEEKNSRRQDVQYASAIYHCEISNLLPFFRHENVVMTTTTRKKGNFHRWIPLFISKQFTATVRHLCFGLSFIFSNADSYFLMNCSGRVQCTFYVFYELR